MLPLLEDPPFVVPLSSTATPRSTTLTPLVGDQRAIARLIGLMLDRGGVSLSEAARRMGVSASDLRQYVHGRRRPSLYQVLRIAEATGTRLFAELPR